jgi:hypothetical protein
MSRNLNYYRMILRKVSFDRELFSKELFKSNQYLSEEDNSRLRQWLVGFYKKNRHLDGFSSKVNSINLE